MTDAPQAQGPERSRSSETSQTLSRGLDVLALVCASDTGLTPAQIAAELELSRTIVYRLVGTLVEHRLVRRNADGLLSAGLGTLALTQNFAPTLRQGSHEILETLAEELGATAHLSIADGDEALAVAVVEPRSTTFHVSYRPGSRTPLELGAVGQALLAARHGERKTFASEGKIVAGACGIVASLPGISGLACALGVVTLAGTDTAGWDARVRAAAVELEALLNQ
ncbi:IclR family transcriptional regulator [Nocardia alba]|uniref:IclR-like helix-turn-helix domain-containing protein n=1 Tax=Nocardia alba TaxID=225051 RepID=A0A4R1FS92_9NOCA|nr:helix-turn-helix domain-containing protein [Nocardia alba]TCJ96482.1 IclR-like helix-turn-helix domain-containing protein [Nocardia alba]